MPGERNSAGKAGGDSSGLSEWMATPEGAGVMDRLARSVWETVLSRNLSLSFINKDPFGSRVDSDLFREIRSELVLFFLENAHRVKIYLMSGQRHFPVFMKQRFLSHWLSDARTPCGDPFRYLYKRAQDLLRETEGFFIRARKGRSTAFSKRPRNRTLPPLVEEDLRGIPFPPGYHRAHEESVKTKGAILGLAGYFWDQVHGLWGKEPVWVDIRDFISWIGRHVPLERAAGEAGFPEDGGEFPESRGGGARGTREAYWDPDAVRSWALNFFNQADLKQLMAFQLYHQENLTFEKIALKMGYKGSSGPKYAVDRVAAGLDLFLRDLPWLSPDDLRKEAFALFFDSLFALLKNNVQAP